MNGLHSRLRKIEDHFLETPKFIKKMKQVFSDNDFNRLTSKDVSKMMVLMPDKYQILKSELLKQMEASL